MPASGLLAPRRLADLEKKRIARRREPMLPTDIVLSAIRAGYRRWRMATDG
jgi:hypothetical protein